MCKPALTFTGPILSGLFVLMLVGCGGTEEEEFQTTDAAGNTTNVIKSEDGTATIKSGAKVPVDLPAGFTLFPGAEVISNVSVKQEGDEGGLVTMGSNASPQEMADFYRAQAKAAGIVISLEMTTGAGRIIGGEGPGGLIFSFSAQPTAKPAGAVDEEEGEEDKEDAAGKGLSDDIFSSSKEVTSKATLGQLTIGKGG